MHATHAQANMSTDVFAAVINGDVMQLDMLLSRNHNPSFQETLVRHLVHDVLALPALQRSFT